METTEPRRRRWALVLPVVLTVLLGALLGGYIVFENQQQAERIEAADDVGADFLAEVATFRAEINEALDEADEDDPKALREALSSTWGEPPMLPEVDRSAAELSTTYAEAERVAAELLGPYEQFDAALQKAERDQTFSEAATEVLQLDVSDYVQGTLLSSSSQLRQSLIPAFVQARDEFASVAVPEGAENAAQLTRAALQSVIDGATQLANSIEANRNYTFSYGEAHNTAIRAVNDFSAQANGDFTEALNAIRDLAGTP